MAGKPTKPGNPYAMPKVRKGPPKVKGSANTRTLAHMKKRLSKPAKWS